MRLQAHCRKVVAVAAVAAEAEVVPAAAEVAPAVPQVVEPLRSSNSWKLEKGTAVFCCPLF
jgi:hypothetical protein